MDTTPAPESMDEKQIDFKKPPKDLLKNLKEYNPYKGSSPLEQVSSEFSTLESFIYSAEDADDLLNLVNVYKEMLAQTENLPNKQKRRRMTISKLARHILIAGSYICADKTTGTASPEVVLETVGPAFREIMNITKNDPMDYTYSKFLVFSKLAIALPEGTVERKVSYLFAKEQVDQNPENKSRFASILKTEYEPDKDYMSVGVIMRLDQKVIQYESAEALEKAAKRIFDTLFEIKNSNHPIAKQIIDAFEKLKNSPKSMATDLRLENTTLPYPIKSILLIANAITPQLNTNYFNDNPLNILDVNNLVNITEAYERILYAIGEEYYKESVNKDNYLEDSSNMRKERVIIEYLVGRWADYQKKTSETLGELTLRLVDQGVHIAKIAKVVQKDISKSSRQTSLPTIRGSKGRTHRERHRPGYGLIS